VKKQCFYGIIYIEKNTKKESEFMKKNVKVEEEIMEKIKKVDGAMAQEGMPLTKEIKQKLYNCITGKSTTDIERKKIIEKYRGIYG